MSKSDKPSGETSSARSQESGVRLIILGLFFLSGACALVYEVVWMRMLTLVFGATAFATSAILASLFAGLALGGALFGRVIDRGRRPLFVYGLLEAGIGVSAFLMPLLISMVTWIYVGVSRQFDIGFYGISLVRFALAFLVLITPATLMGGTLPVIIKFFARRQEKLGWHIGHLYSLNTFGAVVGTLSAGYFLILWLGVKEAAYLAAVVNLLIAGVVLMLDRRVASQPAAAEAPDKAPAEAPAVAREKSPKEQAGEKEGDYSPRAVRLAPNSSGSLSRRSASLATWM